MFCKTMTFGHIPTEEYHPLSNTSQLALSRSLHYPCGETPGSTLEVHILGAQPFSAAVLVYFAVLIALAISFSNSAANVFNTIALPTASISMNRRHVPRFTNMIIGSIPLVAPVCMRL